MKELSSDLKEIESMLSTLTPHSLGNEVIARMEEALDGWSSQEIENVCAFSNDVELDRSCLEVQEQISKATPLSMSSELESEISAAMDSQLSADLVALESDLQECDVPVLSEDEVAKFASLMEGVYDENVIPFNVPEELRPQTVTPPLPVKIEQGTHHSENRVAEERASKIVKYRAVLSVAAAVVFIACVGVVFNPISQQAPGTPDVVSSSPSESGEASSGARTFGQMDNQPIVVTPKLLPENLTAVTSSIVRPDILHDAYGNRYREIVVTHHEYFNKVVNGESTFISSPVETIYHMPVTDEE